MRRAILTLAFLPALAMAQALGPTVSRGEYSRQVAGIVNVKTYGALGNGTSDDTAALKNAIAAAAGTAQVTGTGAVVQIPAGTYLITSTLGTVPQGVILRGTGKRATVLKKGFDTTDLMALDLSTGVENLRIDGNGHSGTLIHVTGSAFQFVRNVETTNGTGVAIGFDANKGSSFTADSCDLATNQTVGSAASVGILAGGSDSSAVPRRFVNCSGAGATLLDLGGMNNAHVVNCRSEGLLCSRAAGEVFLGGNRIGDSAGTITSQTWQSLSSAQVLGNAFAPAIVLNNSTDVGWISSGPSGTPSETGTSSGNHLFLAASYTPTWTAASVNPTLGNGTLTGQWTRYGNQVTAYILLTIGSSTTLGTGRWSFSLPFSTATGTFVGQALATDVSVPTRTAMACTNLTAATVACWISGGANSMDSANPIAVPAVNDTYWISYTYLVP